MIELVDLLIIPRWIIPVEPAGVLLNHALAVKGGRVAAIVPAGEAKSRFAARDTLELPGPNGAPLTVYRARRDGHVAAVVFKVEGKGYAGPVASMMAVDRDGRIVGVRVVAHKETPGLGDKIEPAKDRWIFAFEGKSLGAPPPEKFAVKKDGGVFDQFAGATITPRAVVNSVKGGLEFFGREKSKLLDEEKS